MRFKAAVLHRTGGRFSIEDVTLQPLAPGDVLVRLHASGLCHTDLEVIEGSLPYPLPIVLGHEGAGVVERVGGAVTQVRPGEHVVCSWNPHCGHCFYCERGQPILCEPDACSTAAPDTASTATGCCTTSRSSPPTPSTAWCPSRVRSACRPRSRSTGPV
jgi:Zn-dependent alcohol dehydrogenase